MKTHNRLIYHCQSCGRVRHEEPGAPSPSCCGKPMAQAAAETVCEPNGLTLTTSPPPDSKPKTGPETPRTSR